MEARPFNPPEPVLERAHDVRRLGTCKFCERLGLDLPILVPSPRKRGRIGEVNAHTYCIVTYGGGFAALAALPKSEIDKTRMFDFLALGLTYDELNAKLAEVHK